MKTIASFILFMFAGTLFLTAQTQTQATNQTQEKKYAWDETTHDFGKLMQNDKAVATFTVKNNGATPLIITTAKSSCGCTVAEYTKEPIKPGETGIVKATYNTSRIGTFNKSVTVTFDGYNVAEVLRIKGEVEVPATETPKSTQ